MELLPLAKHGKGTCVFCNITRLHSYNFTKSSAVNIALAVINNTTGAEKCGKTHIHGLVLQQRRPIRPTFLPLHNNSGPITKYGGQGSPRSRGWSSESEICERYFSFGYV